MTDAQPERIRVARYGSGPVTTIALHGWLGSHRTFSKVAPELVEPDRAVLAPDLPGYGRSAEPREWTLDAIVDELAEVIFPQLDTDRPITLVGACSGGAVAVRLAQRLPADRLRHVVLVEPFSHLPLHFRIFTWPIFGWAFYTGGVASPLGRAVVESLYRRRDRGGPVMTVVFTRVRHTAVLKWLGMFRREVRRQSMESTPPPAPVTFVVASRTFRTVRESVRRLRAAWSGTPMQEVQVDASHLLLRDQPILAAQIIRDAERRDDVRDARATESDPAGLRSGPAVAITRPADPPADTGPHSTMDFELSDVDREIQQAARSYAEEVVRPKAAELDRKEEFDIGLWEEAKRRKLVGIAIPKEYGGNGLGNLQLSIVLEEINRVCASTGITLSVHNSLLASPIINYGSEEQKQRFLPKIASGEWLGCYSLTEPGSGSDAAGLVCKAEKQGDKYIVNGVKSWVTSGQFAGVVLLMARTGEHKTRGITSFVIPMDTPGVSVSKHEEKSGLRGSTTNELTFTNVEVPAENVLGEEGIGFKIALSTLDGGRIGVGAQALGIGRACLEHSVDMIRKAEEAGAKGPVLEAGKNYIAEIKMRLDAARLLVWRAATLRDAKKNCTAEGAMAKLMASQTANFAADKMMQIHGETGYLQDRTVERLMRDARITEIYEGTTEIQKLVISRSLLSPRT